LRANADGPRQRLDSDLISLPTSPSTFSFGTRQSSDQFAGGRRSDAELVFFLADGETGELFLDDESRDAL